MPPEQTGPVREDEQRRSAAVVGVDDVEFLGFADSEIVNSPELRAAIIREMDQRHPDVVLTLYRGPEWAPGAPNQSDHIELGNAVVQAIGESGADVVLFENGPEPTHRVDVTEDDVENAVRSLAQHDQYLSVLDPDTPVEQQARAQVEMTIHEDGGQRFVGLTAITR